MNDDMSQARKSDFSKYEKEDLVMFLEELQEKLSKKKMELQVTREKLNSTRKKLLRAKESVAYQRNRIIELSGTRQPVLERVTSDISRGQRTTIVSRR
jgi:hypothetical protein